MNETNIIFDANAPMTSNGGGLRGYLFVHPPHFDEEDARRYGYTGADPSWTFENVLARLNRIANQVIFDDGNFDKSSFTANGTYKGEFFNLYDYKGDKSIHVGGGDKLDVQGLVSELKVLINKAEPKPFNCICSYTHRKYSYP